ncbi:MAG: response regulator [Rhizobiales bacterium]|nr:response regulator [Hyphomicrobiales bacterium]MBO6699127.1 response regulator [Hyphomicrobiales bacterium]MBO6736665.1 response regulator [Hyphomicrobiales bacterium]MBO6912261.1 response regulator [Hyphomicrobiales bacterium]MBO6956264.1 response regulator [Hyphomicrobiales bacterium]
MSRFDFSDLRVLVVDDNVHMCRLVRTMLSAFGMRHVTDASDGAEALERLEQGQFEILIVDWEMPVLDGADFVRLVRNPDHLFCYAPIIMITGHSTYRRTQEALALGVNDVLCKPFSPQALYARIADNVLKPRPFIRSPDYFGPKPRLDPEESDPLDLDVTAEGVGSTGPAAGGAIDLDAIAAVD